MSSALLRPLYSDVVVPSEASAFYEDVDFLKDRLSAPPIPIKVMKEIKAIIFALKEIDTEEDFYCAMAIVLNILSEQVSGI